MWKKFSIHRESVFGALASSTRPKLLALQIEGLWEDVSHLISFSFLVFAKKKEEKKRKDVSHLTSLFSSFFPENLADKPAGLDFLL